MREITITLGGREFVIHELTIFKSQKWRAQANEFLSQFTDINVSNPESDTEMIEYFQRLQKFLAGSLETVLDLACAYSAALEEDRSWIEENAYEREVIVAFRSILQFAYPVDFLAQNLYQAMSGSPDSPTSTNSHVPSGVSGQTN
jgi:hypothetical protein